MAIAADVVREAAAQLCRQEVNIGRQFSKQEVIAAINGMDALLTSSETAINNAFPEPFRSQATVPMKAAVLAFAALRRYAPSGTIGGGG